MTYPSKYTDEERWEQHKIKYHSRNPISRKLIDGFYNALEEIITQLDPELSYLEVGCGIGISSMRIYQMLSDQHMEVSDISEGFVTKLRESDFPLPVSQESVLDLQREDKSFDVVLLLEVLEHIEDYEQALRELSRVAQKYVIISVPNEPLWRILNMVRGKYWLQLGNTPTHINHWSAQDIRNLINQYGKVETVYNPLPWSIVLASV